MVGRKSAQLAEASVFSDIVYGEQRDAFGDETSRRAVRAWTLGARTDWLAGIIRGRASRVRMDEALGKRRPFRRARLDSGDLLLGEDLASPDSAVRLDPQVLRTSCLIGGNAGSGKTLLLAWILLQLARLGCVVWGVEMYKTELRHLVPLFERLGRPLAVLRHADWKHNLMDAGRLDPRLYISLAVDLLCRVLDLPGRARSIVLQACHALYRKFSVFQGRTDAFPTLFDLYEWVKKAPGLNAAAREAILDRLGSLLMALTPKVAAYRRGFDPIALSKHSCVMELRGTSEAAKQILLYPTIHALFQYEVQRGVVAGRLSQVVALEDSQRFLDTSEHIGGAQIDPLGELLSVTRSSGKALLVNAQSMQGISRRLTPNLGLKIMARMGTHADYRQLGSDLGLNAEQLAHAKRLRPGEFIGQAPVGWPEPFLFKAPFLRIRPTVSDNEAAQTLSALASLHTVPAEEFADWHPDHVVDLGVRPDEGSELSEEGRRYLRLVVEQPGQKARFYAKNLGMNGSRSAKVRRRLVELGLVREHRLATAARGRPALILEPLDGAQEALGDSRCGAASSTPGSWRNA